MTRLTADNESITLFSHEHGKKWVSARHGETFLLVCFVFVLCFFFRRPGVGEEKREQRKTNRKNIFQQKSHKTRNKTKTKTFIPIQPFTRELTTTIKIVFLCCCLSTHFSVASAFCTRFQGVSGRSVHVYVHNPSG